MGSSRETRTVGDDEGKGTYRAVIGCFFLSGLAALLYQTAWMRQFAVVFGTSELAIATVLAAYMAGLTLGASLAGRWIDRVRRPIVVYGLLECGVAAGALLVPVELMAVRWLQRSLLGGLPELPDAGGVAQPLFYVAATFAVILLPTACMGATLPLLTRYVVQSDEQIGRRVGTLYAINTCGAVVGTLLAAFVLLPNFGLFRTTLFGVAANVAVLAIAARLAASAEFCRERPPWRSAERAVDVSRSARNTTAGVPYSAWVLPIMFVSGAVSFLYEVLWSRLLGQVVGGSVYAFATMLATFLTGITLGSAIAARWSNTRRQAVIGLALSQTGIGLLSIIAYQSLDSLPELAARWGAGAGAGLFANVTLCASIMLPAALCIGATFPFAVRILARDESDAATALARVYSWNTIGGVLGAISAGFLLIPELGFAGTIRVAVACNLLLAAGTLTLVPWPRFGRRPAIVAATLALLAVLAYQPAMPERLLSMSPMTNTPMEGESIYWGIGRSSTVRLVATETHELLTNNGLPEARILPKGTPPLGRETHRWLTAIPLLARPQAESLLVVGFGSGGAIEVIPPSVKDIDVVELEPEVITANRLMSKSRSHDPLRDPRVRVIINDARSALTLSDKRYDLIVSQPSHPWTAGASHLYTREFIQQVHEHLHDDGLFLQWMNAGMIDPQLFRVLGRTMLAEFPHVRLYMPNSRLLYFIASDSPLEIEQRLAQTGEPLRSCRSMYARLGVNNISDIAGCLVLDEQGLQRLCGDAEITTDDRNQLAFGARPHDAESAADAIYEFIRSEDVIVQRRSELFSDDRWRLSPGIVARRLAIQGSPLRIEAFAKSFASPGEQAFVRGVAGHHQHRRDEARRHLADCLRHLPDHNEARFVLLETYVDELANGTAPPEIVHEASQLYGAEAVVLRAQVLLQRGDHTGVRKLETDLARVANDRLCYPFALSARAAWRASPQATRTDRPDLRRRRAADAIVMVDRAMIIAPRIQTFMVRFNAAVMADRPDETLEAMRAYLLGLVRNTEEPEAADDLRRATLLFDRMLTRLEGDRRLSPDRLAPVTQLVHGITRRLPHPNPQPVSTILPASFERVGRR